MQKQTYSYKYYHLRQNNKERYTHHFASGGRNKCDSDAASSLRHGGKESESQLYTLGLLKGIPCAGLNR